MREDPHEYDLQPESAEFHVLGEQIELSVLPEAIFLLFRQVELVDVLQLVGLDAGEDAPDLSRCLELPV